MATPAKTPEITAGIDVTISEAQRSRLCAMAADSRPSEALSGIATGLLQDLADGGMMLNGRTVDRIAAALSDSGFGEEALIKVVEKGVRRFGQASIVDYAIDPIYISPLEEWSKSNGRTVQELVQDCMSICFDNEYFYSLDFERRPLYLTVEQYRELAEMMGKELIFGADLFEFIRKSLNEAPDLVVAAK